jgi:hypothetical protein
VRDAEERRSNSPNRSPASSGFRAPDFFWRLKPSRLRLGNMLQWAALDDCGLSPFPPNFRSPYVSKETCGPSLPNPILGANGLFRWRRPTCPCSPAGDGEMNPFATTPPFSTRTLLKRGPGPPPSRRLARDRLTTIGVADGLRRIGFVLPSPSGVEENSAGQALRDRSTRPGQYSPNWRQSRSHSMKIRLKLLITTDLSKFQAMKIEFRASINCR